MNVKQLIYRLVNLVRRLYWFVFRPQTLGVKVVIENSGQYLMIRHSYGKSYWTFPGGGVHRAETPEAAAKREVEEEVGIELISTTSIGNYTSRREYKRDLVYCFYASINDDKFKIDGSEIQDARWFNKKQLPEYLSPAVEKILNMLKD